jgi:hypothetical protein
MHSVTSNAVAEMFNNAIDNTKFAMSNNANTEVTANYTGILYLNVTQTNAATTAVFENGTRILQCDMYTGTSYYNCFTILIRKGYKYSWSGQNTIHSQSFIPFF